eukprot:1789014-Pyramimonas_sp.AAC.1
MIEWRDRPAQEDLRPEKLAQATARGQEDKGWPAQRAEARLEEDPQSRRPKLRPEFRNQGRKEGARRRRS